MYPYVMRGDNMPKRMIRELTEISIDKVANLMNERYVLCEVTLNTPLNFLGVLYKPDKYTITNTTQKPHGSKLLFPIGEFRETLHHNELTYALKMGFVNKIHRCIIYERADLFTEYIDFFTKMKVDATNDNNPTYRLMAKLFLNSLYGKFAQRHKWFEPITEHVRDKFHADIVHNIDTGKTHSEFKWFGETWGNFTDGWVEHSIPVIAGAVTANARMLLWDYIYEIGVNNMYYTDTDSLVTNTDGYNFLQPFIHDTTLGKLKLEKTTDRMSIYGCKDYRFGDERVLKGVPKNAIEVDKHTFEYEQFEGVAQWQRRDMSKPPTIFTTTKTKRTEYDKGIQQIDGTVIPYEFKLVSL